MKELVGKLVTNIYVSNDESFMKFDIKDEQPIIYKAYGDCCSETWFADILVGYRFHDKDRENYPLEVVGCEELDIPEWLQEVIVADGRGRQDSDAVYGFKLTFKDHAWKPVVEHDLTIIFRNSSNGYCGGEVILADQQNNYTKKALEYVEWVKIDSEMSLLRMALQQEERFVYLNGYSFINTLSCCSYEGILDLTSVSFSSERVHFNYVLNSGQHVADSCTMLDYLKWKETL